jgi:hypothetical protein
MPERRPRIPEELAGRIDGVRGGVPFERFVREALEQALGGQEPGDTVSVSSPRQSGTLEEVAPTEHPVSARASAGVEPKIVFAEVDFDTTYTEGVEAATPYPIKPTAQQLAGKNNVTVMVAKRWLESDEWRRYW